MPDRPNLTKQLSSELFREHYYLKEELVSFCRENGLSIQGGKLELTERIAHYLDTGEALEPHIERVTAQPSDAELTVDSVIESNFVCSQKHRAFFQKQIGKSFSFNVQFQKWLKANPGKTYRDAISAYHEIVKAKRTTKTTIDKQFEYNTYIRDFFSDNTGKHLDDAIKCWKYKKSLKGHNCYERSDLTALEKEDQNEL